MRRLAALLALTVGAGFAVSGLSCKDDCDKGEALELFERRIEPLLDPSNPSSCNECHAQGVNLALYAQGDACATMACMVDRGIVDFDDPEASLVLSWIDRSTPTSPLITEETIAAEHAAMLEWIDFNARCGARVCPTSENPCGGAPSRNECEIPPAFPHELGSMPWDDPGDCTERTLELMFQAKVYSWRGRCEPCHWSDYDGDFDEAPEWIEVGPCDVASVQSMHHVLELGLIDFATPEQSLLLLKPTAMVEHGGDQKIDSTEESTYVDFLAWIERYVACNPPSREPPPSD